MRSFEGFRHFDPPSENVSLKNLRRFVGFSVPYWPWLAGGFVAGLARLALPLYMPLFVKGVIDDLGKPFLDGRITADQVWSGMSRTGLWLALITLVHAAASLGRAYFPQRAAANAVRDVRFRLYSHLQRLSLGFHSGQPTGSMVARVMQDVSAAQESFDIVLVQLSQEFVQAAVIAGVIFTLDWQWSLVALATTPLFVIATRLTRRHMRRVSRQQREVIARMSGLVQERFAMIREVQAFTAEEREERQVLGEAEALRRLTLRQRLLSGLLRSSAEITHFVAFSVVLLFGVYRIVRGSEGATLGALPMFVMYTGQLMRPLQFFADLYTRMQISAAAADRVFEFLDAQPTVRSRPGAPPLRLAGPPRIRFEGVGFAYPSAPDTPVLRDVTLELPPGTRTVLVGPSGAGKTTMVSLVPRFYDVLHGRLLVNGQDVRDVDLTSLRETIGIVAQEPVLFAGTLLDNIRYGRPEATEAEVQQAARDANAEEFILRLDDGYGTVLGERGARLSGGQIQRIAIARAFLRNPSILILDEATSDLDAQSEALLLDAMDRLAHGRTTFVIAHRLSVARSADLIVALDGGRVVETGTHPELLASGGLFRRLWDRQVAGTPVASDET